jgi:mono/diheme cytochrome c family protein
MALLPAALAADAWKLPAETSRFKPGPGASLAIANCALCHSADYISTQPPLSRQAWRAAVEKMRLKFGAPIATNSVDAIADYLASSYSAASAPK